MAAKTNGEALLGMIRENLAELAAHIPGLDAIATVICGFGRGVVEIVRFVWRCFFRRAPAAPGCGPEDEEVTHAND